MRWADVVIPGLQDVTTEDLTRYLRAAGWTVVKADDRRAIWAHSSGSRVFLPQRREPDFDELAHVALRKIARTEERREDEVAIDVAWSRFDKLHVRREAATGAISLSDGIELHDALSSLIVSGARAASGGKRQFVGRWPAEVDAYVNEVRLIPALQGSFVVRALLPLSPPSEQLTLDLGSVATSMRRMSAAILRGSRATVEAARAVANGAPLTTWDEAVQNACSANLCDALSRLGGEQRDPGRHVDVQLDFHWTWSAPAEPLAPVTIPGGLAPVIAAGADYLQGQPEEHSVRLTGLITKLHREEAMGPGDVTAKGFVDQWPTTVRSLRLQLDEVTYRQAISAHDFGRQVRVTARVRRTPNGLELIRTEDFEILAE